MFVFQTPLEERDGEERGGCGGCVRGKEKKAIPHFGIYRIVINGFCLRITAGTSSPRPRIQDVKVETRI